MMKNTTITCLVYHLILFIACLLVISSAGIETRDKCDLNLANTTCLQICNGNDTCNSTCPTWSSLKNCEQICSSDLGCPGNYQCHIPGNCKQDCQDGNCMCSGKNCTQKCSTSYCRNTYMECHSDHCQQNCIGDCRMQCSANATGRCYQKCTGNCKDIKCGHKNCVQDMICRNPPCTLRCPSTVDDCKQTCSYGFCKFNCNARMCRAHCKSGNCKYDGTPRVNTKMSCDRVNLATNECFQEGCGWPNCSLHCANSELPDSPEICRQNCLDPISLCPKSMICKYEKECMQNCYGKCPDIECTSDKCSQICSGKCNALNCNTTTTCLQFCEGTCEVLVCSSPSCIQSCSSANCEINCNEKAKHCHQTCNTKGADKVGCIMESKANSTEHQICGSNCTLMKCGENSANCTQTCTQGCERMVCSSSNCEQECTHGNCTLECSSSVEYCKQTCKTGNCTVVCNAQKCEQDCDGPGCPPRPTTVSYTTPTTSNNTTSGNFTTRPTKPVTSNFTTPVQPTTTNTTRPTEPVTSNVTKPTEPVTSNVTSPTDPVTSNVTKPTEPVTSNVTSPTKPVTSNVTKPTEPVTSSVTSPTEPVTPNVTEPTEPVTSNVTSPTEPTARPTTRETEMTPTSHVTETTGSSCGGETSAQRKIEQLIQSKDRDLFLLLYIVIGLLALLVLLLLMGFACIFKRITARMGEQPDSYSISNVKMQNVYENSAL